MIKDTVELPYFGRDICENTLLIAQQIQEIANTTYSHERARELLAILIDHFDNLVSKPDQEFNEASLFNFPVKPDEWPSFFAPLGFASENESELKKIMTGENGNNLQEFWVHSIRYIVYVIKRLEQFFLGNPNRRCLASTILTGSRQL